MIGSGNVNKMAYTRPPQTGRFDDAVVQYSNTVTLFGRPSLELPQSSTSSSLLTFRRGEPKLFPSFFGADDNQGTIEFWFWTSTTSPNNVVLFRIREVFTSITIRCTTSNRINASARFGATTYTTASYTYNLSAWNHVALTLQNNRSLTLWLNGNRLQTIQGVDPNDVLVTSSGQTYALWGGNFGGLNYRREFRVSRNLRYNNANSTYSVPTGPFVNDDDTYMLFHMDGTDENSQGIPQLIDDLSGVTSTPPAAVLTLTGGIRELDNLTTFKYDSQNNLIWSRDHGTIVLGVAFDQFPFAYTAGARVNNITTRKYNSVGTQQWSRDHGADVNGVAVDQNGNVYTIGSRSGLTVTTRKYNSSGTLQWSVDHGTAGNSVAVDSSGNVYTAGNLTTTNLTTRKYNSSGTLQWSVNHGNGVYGVAVDQNGNVYTGGTRISNLTTRKYNSSGTLQWSVDHGAIVYGVAVDFSGNVYTGGSRISNLTTRKYNSSGALQWSVDHGARVNSIAVDKEGNVYTAGLVLPPAGITLRKYNSSGTLLASWGRTGTANSDRSIDTFPPNKGAFLS